MNLGGLFAAIGRALPGYVEGQRKAVEDNWRDLEKYNSVQKGQLNNLYDLATFGNQIDRSQYAADRDAMALDRMAREEVINRYLKYPADVARAHAQRTMWLNGGAAAEANRLREGLDPDTYNGFKRGGVPAPQQAAPQTTDEAVPDYNGYIDPRRRA